MLVLTLKRAALKADYTVGHLYARKQYICDTLEDTDRALHSDMPLSEIRAKKVYGKTAIPRGRYRVTLDTVSAKFRSRSWAKFCGGRLPRLQNVKGFDGILIHVGNTAEDSLGCILVGENREVGKVLNSTATFRRLYEDILLPEVKAGGEIYLDIV